MANGTIKPFIWYFFVLGLCIANLPVRAQSVTNLYPGTTSIYLPYLSQPNNGQIGGLLTVGVSFGDSSRPIPFVMDTGSTGLVVSQDIYNPTGPSLGPGSITYSSSGKIEEGHYYNASVNFFDGHNIVATAAVPILVVDAIACTPNPRNCTPNDNPTGVSQMGIGFGQEAAGQPEGTPAANPFLNIVSTSTPGGALPSRGYVVTSTGVTLGLTAANTQGYAMVKLSSYTPYSKPGAPEWLLAPATVSVNGTAGSGIILSDTGVTGMYLTPVVGTQITTISLKGVECGTACAPPGTVVQVTMPGQSTPVASYTFTAGTTTGTGSVQPGNALSPWFIAVDTPANAAYVNTTVNFFNGYNYIYDATNGFVGYQYTGAVSGAYGGATPSFALQGAVDLPGGFSTTLPVYLMDISQVYTPGFPHDYLDQSGLGVTISTQGTATFAGPIAGSPDLTFGGGTIILSARNTYTGATIINQGAVLALAGPGSISASSGVTANGVFDISQSWGAQSIASLSGSGSVYLGSQALVLTTASGTFSGVIADGGLGGGVGGSVVVAGGTQTLTGANTYSGGTLITGGGTLAINADAALGAAGAPLTFDDGTLLALGSVATTRPITVQSGGGTIDAGAFTVSLGGPLAAYGPLSTMGTVLLGADATVAGTMTVAGGLFSDNATLTANALVVAQGATLRGIGTVAAPTTVAGTLAPGNSPGTLSFAAPVTMLPGSVTQFDIDGTGTGTGAGNYSRIVVTGAGNGFTAAGTLAPLLRGITGSATNAYTPPLGQGFVVVNAQGGVQGSYSGLTQPAGLAAGTRFDALYGPTALALVVTPQSYGALALAGIAESGNQSAVGSALDAGRPAAGVAMTPAQAGLYAPLYPLSAGAIPGALESLAPTVDADGLMVWRDAWYLAAGAIGSALETRRGGQPDSQEQTAEGPKGSTIWLTALGQFDHVGSAGGVPGYGGSTGGVAAGVDMAVLPWLTAGGALAFTGPQVGTKNGQDFSGQALQVMAYGSAHRGSFFVDAQLGGLFFQDSTTRPLPLYGVQANGQTGGTGFGGSIRAGAQLQLAAWRVEPSLGLAGLGLSQGGFTETQAGAANLAVGSQGLTSIQSVLAARVERRFAVGETMALVPTARIGWLHEFADTVGTATASFAAASSVGGGAPFGVDSAPVGRDAALIGLGATLQTGGPVSLYLGYTGAFAQNANAQTITGGVSVKW